MVERHAAKKQEMIFYLKCNGWQGALGFYRLFFGLASKRLDGRHLCVIRQRS
jgi:hypothetical protein